MREQEREAREVEAPASMDKYTRNRRLYEHLKGMGLVIDPVCVEGDPDRIDQLVVSVAFPPEVELVTLDEAAGRLIERGGIGKKMREDAKKYVNGA